MAQYLLSTSDLEQVIEALINDQRGHCFSSEPTNAVQRLVDGYNASGSNGLLDLFAKPWLDWLEDYTLLDDLVEMFTRLVEGCIDSTTHIAVLDYLPKDEVVVVTQHPRSAPDPVKYLKDEYQHATMQGDFYPERMRRALDELAARI